MKLPVNTLLICILLNFPGYSQKNGITWYDPVPVSEKTFGNLHPRIVLDHKHNPLVLWSDQSGRAFIARWNGKEFEQPEQINTPGKYVFSESWAGPEIASRGDTIYIVYKQIPEEKNHIYLKHSYDGGKNFSIETQVDDTDGYISRFPKVAINLSGDPMVAYLKFDAGYNNPRYVVAKFADLGESFNGEITVANFSGGKISDCLPATILESGNATVMLYRDNTDNMRNIWAGMSDNSRLFFRKGLQVDHTNWITEQCPVQPPSGVIVADTMYSVFMSAPGDTAMIYLAKTSLSGMTSVANQLIGYFPGLTSQNNPAIANSGDAAAITWQQYTGNTGQICLIFTDEITNGFPKACDKISAGRVANPDVAVGGGHVYIAWQDDSTGNIMCRIGRYNESITNKLLSENTTIYLQPSKSGKYFEVSIPGISAIMMIDEEGKEYEMDMKCKKGNCKVNTEDMDPGQYIVRVYGKDDKIYTYKYVVKGDEEKEKQKEQ